MLPVSNEASAFGVRPRGCPSSCLACSLTFSTITALALAFALAFAFPGLGAVQLLIWVWPGSGARALIFVDPVPLLSIAVVGPKGDTRLTGPVS